MALPFDNSRRLIGANLFFATTGAVLELEGIAPEAELLQAWRTRVAAVRSRLGWDGPRAIARVHRRGASLALPAPVDQLFVATEVNEWALCASLLERDPQKWQGLQEALMAAAVEAAEIAHQGGRRRVRGRPAGTGRRRGRTDPRDAARAPDGYPQVASGLRVADDGG